MALPRPLDARLRRQTLHLPHRGGSARVADTKHVVVVGGGIAGIAAAMILAERGVDVTLIERNTYLGGRAGSWQHTPAEGEPYEMERGFHAFFRQYYNLRALLRRVDPDLSALLPLEDYPILGPEGMVQSFDALPRWTPANLISLVRRSPYLRARDLPKVNVPAAVEMLTFEQESTYGQRDHDNAGAYLDSLNFPNQARRMLFDVFAHSFFNPEEDMSAGEMLMMFHFYFTGNPEGLVFDVCDTPMSRALWEPLGERLTELGACVRKGVSVRRVARAADGERWTVEAQDGAEHVAIEADAVVLALDVAGLKRLVEVSDDLAEDPEFHAQIESLDVTSPFYVLRVWLDRPVNADRAPFAGTTGIGQLDNISVYNSFQAESAAWAQDHDGAVVELHAYAVPEAMTEDELRDDLIAGMHALYPETREATIVREHAMRDQDCAAFRPGSYAARPEVATSIDGIALAGDFTRLPFPSALMEKAATSGILAANTLMSTWGVAPEPIETIPPNGLLSKPCPAAFAVGALADRRHKEARYA